MRSKMIGMLRIRKKRALPPNWHTAKRHNILQRKQEMIGKMSSIIIDLSKNRSRGVILMS